ncbi:arsenate reductase (glutaredoxin) [Thiosulfatimonas sediminis]|uniref:Arsenate reductase (Glutaredoxin) n=1 Tax=Thiosulfatimonas sediminis TaxID=2675054 RepID=A0A6F8PVC5_9GAMM|nr:ArsC/Spx/MgsR family protein [Thiosulfatimonas sediminis]BBP45958.1 arsenate reductase (glutaredoxin) [Thiosulfatimonas sediminis]
MPEVMIYHNPSCSKSRGALEILQQNFAPDAIREIHYLQESMTLETLQRLCELLNKSPVNLIRKGEPKMAELNLGNTDAFSDQEWLMVLVENPILIERPIVVYRDKAVIARPPELVLTLLMNTD